MLVPRFRIILCQCTNKDHFHLMEITIVLVYSAFFRGAVNLVRYKLLRC